MSTLVIPRRTLGFNQIQEVGQVVGVLQWQTFHEPVIDLDDLAGVGVDHLPRAVALSDIESHVPIIRRADDGSTLEESR